MGGLGLFLLGMIIMTDSLRALAGDSIRNALMRFTRSPLSGAITGAASTAILQSSSATTVAAVGFVGASLLTFPQALGIIFGANIGTTITGWMVALLGFKLQLATVLLPLILTGTLLRLFGQKLVASIGMGLAGFGLIFVGITVMQQGMSGLQDVITPTQFPTDSLFGILKLVGLGILMTLITQSSSAGVATALTALYAGAINFHQAAALVIGMDVGTTVTAVMASIGGSVGSRRTGISHVIYNCLTGIFALLLLTPYINLWESLAPNELINNAEIALVGFHSLFNILGVIIILPFTHHFAAFITNLIKDKVSIYTRHLDTALLEETSLALTAIRTSIQLELVDLLNQLRHMLTETGKPKHIDLIELQIALDKTHAYADLIHLNKDEDRNWQRLTSSMHALDHLQRLHERCEEDIDRAQAARTIEALKPLRDQVSQCIEQIIESVEDKNWAEASVHAQTTAASILEQVEPMREAVMNQLAAGQVTVPQATDKLEAIRWLKRVSRHIARITVHLENIEAELI